MKLNNLRIKIISSLFIAFITTLALEKQLFLADSPMLKPAVMAALHDVPGTIAQISMKVKEVVNKPEPTVTPTTIPDFEEPPLAEIEKALPTLPPTLSTTPYIVVETPIPTLIPTKIPTIAPTLVPTSIPTILVPTEIPYFPPTPYPTIAPTKPPTTTLAEFGQCLNNKGFIVYTQTGCPACAQQAQELGEGWQYITKINCSEKPNECVKVGLMTTPSWAKNGKIVIPGGANTDYLAYESGCPEPN